MLIYWALINRFVRNLSNNWEIISYPAIPYGARGIAPIIPGAIIPGIPGTPTLEAPGGVGVILPGESDLALFEDGPSSSSSPVP